MATWATLGDRPCPDPEKLADALRGGEPPAPTDWLALPHRYACPIGLAPGRGHVLLLQSDLDALDLTGKLKLVLGEGATGTSVKFPNLRVVGHPRCLDFGVPDPAYLVELADCRADLVGALTDRYQWRYNPTDPVVSPNTDAYDNWADLIEYLWGLLPPLGTFPGMPTSDVDFSAAVLDRLDLHAFPIRDALEDALAAVGCAAAYDPVKDAFTVVYLPTARDKAPAVRKRFRLVYDERPYTPKDWGPVPAVACVLFPAWVPGRSDRETRLVYSVPAGRAANIGPGVTTSADICYLQDFTPARLYPNGEAVDRGRLEDRAAQVGQIYFDRFTADACRDPVRQAFSGLIDDPDVRPGGTYDLVAWAVTADGPVTTVARSGLAGLVELYPAPEQNGLLTSIPTTPQVKSGTTIPKRAGGYIPDAGRERDAVGWDADRRWVSVAGAGAGPLYRRASALRQADWLAVGAGGHLEGRARLWRNWSEAPPDPDDMTRFVLVTGPSQSVTVTREGSARGLTAYPCRPLQQDGDPPWWLQEELGWVFGANGETLEQNRAYLSQAGNHADDNKRLWATFCCSGGSGVASRDRGGAVGGGGPGGPPTDDDDRIAATLPPTTATMVGSPCSPCPVRRVPRTYFITVAGVGTFAYTYNAALGRYLGCIPIPGWFGTSHCAPVGVPGGCDLVWQYTICVNSFFGDGSAFSPMPGVCDGLTWLGGMFISSNCPGGTLCSAYAATCQGACNFPDGPVFGLLAGTAGTLVSCNPVRITGGTFDATAFGGGVYGPVTISE